MDAQGRGQDSWFKAGKPWDPHGIQAGTEWRLRGLPLSCLVLSRAQTMGLDVAPEPGRPAMGSPNPQPCLGNIWQGKHWPREAWMLLTG